MGKPALTKDDLPFVYQLGQDVAKLGNEIDKLKNKSVKAVRIVVPATPDEYQQYGLRAVINLPEECQHAICIKSKRGQVDLVETGETLSVYTEPNTSEFYLAPIYKLEAETINATLDQEQMALIESNIRKREEREERERKEREEREERERKEREEREERKNREESIYKYLAKWLTDNYLEDIRVKAANIEFEKQGINVYVNKNGLNKLLDKPFERNSYISLAELNESIYADAKSAMLTEKARIDRGEVDLNVARDFKVTNYDYVQDFL